MRTQDLNRSYLRPNRSAADVSRNIYDFEPAGDLKLTVIALSSPNRRRTADAIFHLLSRHVGLVVEQSGRGIGHPTVAGEIEDIVYTTEQMMETGFLDLSPAVMRAGLTVYVTEPTRETLLELRRRLPEARIFLFDLGEEIAELDGVAGAAGLRRHLVQEESSESVSDETGPDTPGAIL